MNNGVNLIAMVRAKGGHAGKGKPHLHFGHPDYSGLVYYPGPQMDWGELRRLKKDVCPGCGYYDDLLSGCRVGITLNGCPLDKCPKKKV